TIKIEKQDWEQGLEKLKESYRLFGPMPDKDALEFKALNAGDTPVMGDGNTRLSVKSVIYPQSQTMFTYTLDESKPDHHIMKQVELRGKKPRAVVGVRPCDAASFKLVRRNFDSPEYKDPFWVEPYEDTTLVGYACDEPSTICFCTSVGCGPYHEAGLDLFLVKEGDDFFAKILTKKGEDLAAAAGWSAHAEFDFESRKTAAEKKITAKISTDGIKEKKTTELFEAGFWEQIGFSCLNCGTCTYSCPTCWCFDIQDEVKGTEGKRIRNWDSCMYSLFTLEGSGHNPRPNKVSRVRQRFMHKLKYYVDKYDAGVQCVGCGRCIQLCPVNIDIRDVFEIMRNYTPAPQEA
ncbi:MAG: 4Fe-4S dicluster domain-containing protein, partial [Desulfobacterales bacterium]|nr:4Fe-4S dicluster domain-containing protein [Desulfobacterales bacterium]